uniref:Heterogeneous nuclear ribonucleoprotein K n=1 Tax=Panagrellus redivivus TaxID=6233 RepID=A0A7E4V3F4_PANRE
MDMKRHSSDSNSRNNPGGSKRYRVDPYNEALADGKFELRLLIPNKSAGAVIGKGGENIKAVREKYDASLTVPDRSTPERVFGMIVSLEKIVDCFTDVLAKLAETFDQEQRREKVADLDIRVLVHHSHAGAIIGRGGSKIKELREQTGSMLKVYQECCPNSTDRVVQINTTQEKMPNAVKTLIDFMRDIPIKGNQKPYDPACYDHRMVYSYGGFGSDRPGPPGGPPGPPGPMGGGPRMGGPPMDFHHRMPPPGVPPEIGYGMPPPPGPYGNRMPPPPPPMANGPGFMMGGGNMQAPQQVQVTIPNELGGTIIGKGGERINRIRQQSGARIEIASSSGPEDRVITIIGTQPQIQAAQYMLQQSLRNYSVRNSEAGRRYMQHEQLR